ncbi:hypothetical protein FACS1894167_08970 [Synergistales bacterium]|nr:hypothetical protein FACS1894167_08970 [Synergistales bacterium]
MANEKEKDNKIVRPHLIVCEGLDAKKYLIYFLQHLIKDDPRYDNFQVMDGKGITDLPLFLKTLPDLPNFNIVKTLTIIRDSETDSANADKSVRQMLKKCKFTAPDSPCAVAAPSVGNHPVAVGYALFPELNKIEGKGTLEDLCLETLAGEKSEELLKIVHCAIKSVNEQFGALERPHKNELHTYLSLTDKFVGLKLGESANTGAFDFSAREVEPLKNLLCSMLEQTP